MALNAARRHIRRPPLAYCRFREPAVVLLGRVGAASGRRPDRDSRRPGQVVLVGSQDDQGARLSVVVDRLWRAEALAEMIVDAGLQPEIARTEENTPLVRTAVDPRLVPSRATGPAAPSRPCRAMAARPARAAGLDARRRQPGGRSLPARPGSARPGYPFAACLGPDAGRDSANAHRHPRRPARAADQRPTTAIAPGRERGGTSGKRRGVLAMAPHLRARPGVSLRRVARGAKLAVANGADRRRTHDPAAWATQKWSVGTVG